MIMSNLPNRYDNVMSAWDNIPDVSKTLENLTFWLFQQETRLNNRLEGSVEKVTSYAASLKASETWRTKQRLTLTYEQH
jgi:hypothetical protein